MPDKTVVVSKRPIYGIKRKSGGTFLEGSMRYPNTELNCDVTKFYSPYEVKSYRDVIKARQLATTNMTITGRNSSSSTFRGSYRAVDLNNPYVGVYEDTGYLEGSFCRLYPGAVAPLISQSSVVDQAWVNFIKKAKAAQRSFQGGVFVGELREAIHMIVRPAQAIRRGLDEYLSVLRRRSRGLTSDSVKYRIESRKRSFGIYRGSDYVWPSDHVITRVPITDRYGLSRRRAIARVVHDTWLEYAFGWKPLVNDVLSGAKALAERAYKPDVKRITGKAGKEVRSNPVDNALEMTDSNTPFKFGIRYRTWRGETFQAKFHGAVSADKAVGDYVLDKSQNLGFSWSEVVPTIWELIPYSFVVDYFTNLGDLIEVASFNQADLLWMYYGHRRETNWSAFATQALHYDNDPAYEIRTWALNSPGRCDVTDFEIKRMGSLYPGPPSLRFKIPGVGSTKWINMAALVASRDKLRRELRI